jgi:hypothetical protein
MFPVRVLAFLVFPVTCVVWAERSKTGNQSQQLKYIGFEEIGEVAVETESSSCPSPHSWRRRCAGQRLAQPDSWPPRTLRLVVNMTHASLARACAALLLLFNAVPILAQSNLSEYDTKAAYLFNFGRFMRHSGGYIRTPTFDICILGRDTIGRRIDDIAASGSIDNRAVRIIRIPDVTLAKSCAIVFISFYENERIQEDLAILAGTEVLTVSDASGFLKRGGMIEFVVLSSHERFAVNLSALNRAHLVLSSELLRVAASVTGKPPTGELP